MTIRIFFEYGKETQTEPRLTLEVSGEENITGILKKLDLPNKKVMDIVKILNSKILDFG